MKKLLTIIIILLTILLTLFFSEKKDIQQSELEIAKVNSEFVDLKIWIYQQDFLIK